VNDTLVGAPWQALLQAAEAAGPAEEGDDRRSPLVVPILAAKELCAAHPEVVQMLRATFTREQMLKIIDKTAGLGIIDEANAILKR
jgi:hypothetical protein